MTTRRYFMPSRTRRRCVSTKFIAIVVGTDPAQDQLVYQEDDETFVAYIFKTKSKKFLMIVSAHTNSQEYRYLEADQPFGEFKIFLPREREHEYHVDHFRRSLYHSDQPSSEKLSLDVDADG